MERKRNPWLVLLVLCLGFFVILLDTTIVNVAVPTMLVSLHASLDQILLVVNAYVLTFAVLLVTGGGWVTSSVSETSLPWGWGCSRSRQPPAVWLRTPIS